MGKLLSLTPRGLFVLREFRRSPSASTVSLPYTSLAVPSLALGQADLTTVDPEMCNENIRYKRSANSEQQHEDLLSLAEEFATGEYRLLIVDSILNLFRSDYSGRGELSERQQKLGQHLRKLTEYAEEFNVAVFMTNQVQSDPGASALFASADGRKPVGGHVLAHASSTRLLLRKGRGEERVAKILDSPGKANPPLRDPLLLCSRFESRISFC